jgi:hypothetical protein
VHYITCIDAIKSRAKRKLLSPRKEDGGGTSVGRIKEPHGKQSGLRVICGEFLSSSHFYTKLKLLRQKKHSHTKFFLKSSIFTRNKREWLF